jgi:hypothetical protein
MSEHLTLNVEAYAEGDWYEDVVPMEEIIPSYTEQEHHMVHLLNNQGTVHGFESNKKGDHLCMDGTMTEVLEHYPLTPCENMLDYSKRVFGFGQEQQTEEQKTAHEYLMAYQMRKEWETMNAYHYPDFVPSATRNLVSFHSAKDKRKEHDNKDDLDIEVESDPLIPVSAKRRRQ